jgi:DNA-directed RNA polymerase II subunit RPB1
VRTANGSVVQFLYGEDGMDGTAIEAQKLDNLRMSASKFRVQFIL